jgi:hypothetical protein
VVIQGERDAGTRRGGERRSVCESVAQRKRRWVGLALSGARMGGENKTMAFDAGVRRTIRKKSKGHPQAIGNLFAMS